MLIDGTARIYVAGHRGLVGSAILRRLRAQGLENLLTESSWTGDQAAVNDWFRANRPDVVFLVAGTVGGFLANATRPAEFLHDNMMVHATVVHASHLFGVKRLLYLGSSCIYRRDSPQPISEDSLLTGPLEPTNEAYALAKIAGIKLCQSYHKQYGCDFISAMPTNLYGPNDNFDIGTGEDLTIALLADLVRDLVHPAAELIFDRSKPGGTPRKLLHVERLHRLGWRHTMEPREGVARTYDWYVAHERTQ